SPTATPTRLAIHLEQVTGSGPNEELANLHLVAADEALTLFSIAEAEWHYLRLKERAGSDVHRADASRGIADTAALRGDQDRAVAEYGLAIDATVDTTTRVRLGAHAIYTLFCRASDRAALMVADHLLRS